MRPRMLKAMNSNMRSEENSNDFKEWFETFEDIKCLIES